MVGSLKAWIAEHRLLGMAAAVIVVALLIGLATLAGRTGDVPSDRESAPSVTTPEDRSPTDGATEPTTTIPGASARSEPPTTSDATTGGRSNPDPSFGGPVCVTGDGIEATGIADPGTRGSAGRVQLTGISGVALSGAYRCDPNGDWSVAVDRVRGSVGGVTLGSDGVSGTVHSVAGAVSGDVAIDVAAHPVVVPAWHQEATLRLHHDGSHFTGAVDVDATRGSGALSMAGPVVEDGSYRLAATGAITFAGSPIDLAGSYESAGYRGAVRPSWTIRGTGANGVIDTVPVPLTTVLMTQARPGVTGSAVLALGTPSFEAATTLSFVDEGDWSMQAVGSDTATWRPAAFPALTVQTAGLTGTVTSGTGIVTWRLAAGMSLVDEQVTLGGTFRLTAPQRWSLAVDGGEGDILGVGRGLAFERVTGRIAFDHGTVEGSVDITDDGELFVDLPSGWVSRTDLSIRFTNHAGPAVATRDFTHAMTNKNSRLALHGSFKASDAFKLTASGSLAFAGGAMPVGGTFESVGWVSGGVARTQPYWTMAGEVTDAIPLGDGTSLARGSIGLTGGPPRLQISRSFADALTPAAAAPSPFTGEVEVALSPTTTATITGSVNYTDEDNWTFTALATQGDPWSPIDGLVIQTDTFHGTAQDVDGDITWNMTIDEVTWSNVTTGVHLSTSFSMSNECPLTENCPDLEGLYVGFTGGALDWPSPVPDMSLDGAFLNDGSWARFDAASADLTYNGITVSDPQLSMWLGERTDSFDPDLVMPDLASANKGWGVEFCGNFDAEVPDVATVHTGGCVEWSPDGVVMGQVGTGGDVDSGESNGVTIGATTLTGFGWTDLTTTPTLTLTGIELALEEDRNELTATMKIPEDVMHAVGAGDDASTIDATGWFTTSGDFSLDAYIAVELRSGGFTLDSISVHIGKDDKRFSLGLGAEATVSVSGNHFPVSAFVGVEAGGGSDEIIVRLSVQGAVSDQPDGSFDTPTLLPTGNFEPDLPSLVEGDFDGHPPADVLDDNGFENAVATGNLFTNDGFEDGVTDNLLANGDLEDGSVGNLLTNGDLEDDNVLVDGDFESGTTSAWPFTPGYTATVTGDSAPSGETGTYVATLENNSSTNTGAGGFYQIIHIPAQQGASFTFTVWARATDGSNGRAVLYVSQQNTPAGCATTNNVDAIHTYPVTTDWTPITLTVTGACKGRVEVFMNVPDIGRSVSFDAATFVVNSSPAAFVVPNQVKPYVVDTMGTTSAITTSGSTGVSTTSDYGNPAPSLRSDGSGKWWNYNAGNWGSVTGDFDMSYDVYFPASDSRDIMNMGFWLTGSSSTRAGYALRLQTAFGSSADSGLWTVGGGRLGSRLTSSPGVIPRSVWHQVHLTAVDSLVTVTITNIATGAVFWTTDFTMPSGNRAGVFGQIADGAGASVGHRYDNLTIYSGDIGNTQPRVVQDPGNARTGQQYLAVNPPSTNWSVQASTLEAPAQGYTYTYTAWVRSRGADITGEIALDTVGGTYESAARSFTANGTWRQIGVTLPVQQSGHTDLRPTLRNLSAGGTQLDIDDMVLQAVPWKVTPTTPGAALVAVPTDGSTAHDGLSGVQFTDLNHGSTVSALASGAPTAGGNYTVTAWIRSASPASARLWLYAEGGTTESASTAITTTTEWTKYTTTLPVTRSGHSSLRFAVDNLDGSLQIDDVVVTADQVTLPQDATSAWQTNTTGLLVRKDTPNAHTGSAYMQYTRPSGNASWIGRTVPADGRNGNTYTGSAWVRATAGNVSGTIQLSSDSGTSESYVSAAKNFTATSTWQQVSVDLQLKASTTEFELAISHKTPGKPLLVDDTGVQLVGLSQKAPWVGAPGPGGTMAVAVHADPARAHQGNNFLEVQANGAAGQVHNDVERAVKPGQTYTFSAWVRSPSGTPVSGSIQLAGIGGATTEQASAPFTATGTWQHVFVTLPVKQANTSLRSNIALTTLGQKLDIDDVSTTAVATWLPWGTEASGGTPVNELVVHDQSSAASGSSYAVMANQNTAYAGISSPVATTVRAGAMYQLQAYVRSTTGANINGRIRLTASGTSTEAVTLPFTATADWQLVTLPFTATKSNTTLTPQVDLATAGQLDIDSFELTQDLIIQDDPWINVVGAGGSVTATIHDNPSRAHDSNGVLEISKTGSDDSGTFHDIAEVPAVGRTYVGSMWVRSSTGQPVNGQFLLSARGGTAETATATFTATSSWQLVSLTLPITHTGHTSMRAQLVLKTAGITLDVDDVVVQPASPWAAWGSTAGVAAMAQVNDGAAAQSGSGYLTAIKHSSPDAGVRLDTAGAVAVGTHQTATAYVRSTSGANAPGRLTLTATGGSKSDAAIVSFTATSDWQKISVTLPVGTAGQTSLRTQFTVDGVNLGIDIDTVTLGQEPLGRPDGVTTPLPHPETGYAYLWDDAFGIPGAHLWSMTAQIEIVNGFPALGVGATMYLDPTKASTIMTGTAWLKGDMALNVSEAEPCFSFGFDGGDSGTAIHIDGGVFTTSKFQINVAPRGCEVGDYVVQPGARLAFDTGFGDTTIHLDLEIGRDDNNLPTFSTDLAIKDLTLAGTLYRTMQLTVDISATSQDVSFVGDFALPMGNFYGTFDLSSSTKGLHMEGLVSLTDWQMAGGTFDVTSFSYYQLMDIPYGAGSCANFTTAASGDLSVGHKRYTFDGKLVVHCGTLQLLHFGFDYAHGGVLTRFNIDYDASTRILAGGVGFQFERSTSWRHFGHRYSRHPKITLSLAFSMNVDRPSSATLYFGGTISVSGGDGSLTCTFGSSSDDECRIHVHINVFGSHTYDDTW